MEAQSKIQVKGGDGPVLDVREILSQKDRKIRQLEERIAELERIKIISHAPCVDRRGIGEAPVTMASGSVAVNGHVAYFRPFQSGEIYEFNSRTKTWSNVPLCKRKAFSLAVIDGLLTTIGGFDASNSDTATLLSLTDDRSGRMWVEHFPCMPTKRSYSAVVVSSKYLVVAGGMHMMGVSQVLQAKRWTQSVYSCSLPSLESAAYPASPSYMYPIEDPKVWVNLTNLPISRTFCVVVQNHLLAVCGKRNGLRTNIIWSYDLKSNSWLEFDRSSCARSRCLVAVLPGDKLMVVGGWGQSGQVLQSYEVIEVVT